MKLEVLWFQDTLVPSLEQKSSLCFLIYFSSLEPMNTSCQIKILRNPISARLIAHSFFRVWLKSGCSTKYFSMNMFPQCWMTMGKAKVRWVAFCRSLPRGEFLCEALHHWSATAKEEMPLVMIFDDLWWFLNFWSWMIVDLWSLMIFELLIFDDRWSLIFDDLWTFDILIFDLGKRKLFWVQLKQGNLTDLMFNLTAAQM